MWYFTFPILFFIFFTMVGATALIAHIRCRRLPISAPSVVRMVATVQQKRLRRQTHDKKAYQVVFLTEQEGAKVLVLSRVQYSMLAVGMRGVLVCRDKQFLCFEQAEE